jgi:hypothetical protein
VTFSLPEFNLKKQISWLFHVNNRLKTASTYDMIIVRDLLGELGMILNFNDKAVTWDTDTIPMKDRGTLISQNALTKVYLSAKEPQSLVNELSRSTKILDAEYKLAILTNGQSQTVHGRIMQLDLAVTIFTSLNFCQGLIIEMKMFV